MTGNCYASAGQHLMEAWTMGRDNGMVLVHGRPTLAVEPFIQYGHAWIEYKVKMDALSDITGKNVEVEMVLDTESGNVLQRDLYYLVGRIDPESCIRYSVDDMRRWVLKTGHWGPWEGPDACGPVERYIA